MEGQNQSQAQPDPENEAEQQCLLEEVDHILSFSQRRDTEILQLFGAGVHLCGRQDIGFQKMETQHYYEESQLFEFSVKNRLRFLSSKCFSGELPYGVVSVIKAYQHRYPQRTLSFFIVAPRRFFQLKNASTNSLLFCKTSKGYQLLCRWGKELPWYQSLINYPLRSFNTLMACSLLVGFITMVIASFAGIGNHVHLFKSILLKIPILIVSGGFFAILAVCFGLITYMTFSEDNWKSEE